MRIDAVTCFFTLLNAGDLPLISVILDRSDAAITADPTLMRSLTSFDSLPILPGNVIY